VAVVLYIQILSDSLCLFETDRNTTREGEPGNLIFMDFEQTGMSPSVFS